MKKQLQRLSLLAACAAGLAMPASAAVLSQTEFSVAKFAECPGLTGCAVEFPVVPAKHRYSISNISCYAVFNSTTQTVLYEQFVARMDSGHDARVHMHPLVLGSAGGQTSYSSNEVTRLIVDAGGIPTAVIGGADAGTVAFYSCTMSGVDTRLQ